MNLTQIVNKNPKEPLEQNGYADLVERLLSMNRCYFSQQCFQRRLQLWTQVA